MPGDSVRRIASAFLAHSCMFWGGKGGGDTDDLIQRIEKELEKKSKHLRKGDRMDANGNIYIDPAEKIPAEDAARLDGYLRARAEAGEQAKLHAEAKRLRKRLKRLASEQERTP